MKKGKNILIAILIIAVILGGIYLAYSINKKAQEVDNIENQEEQLQNDKENEQDEELKKDEEEEIEEENEEINEEQQTPEEIEQEEKTKSLQEQAIEKVKEVWWGDENASFQVDNSATLAENQMMIRVSQDAANYWYVVNTDTWEVSEY